MTTPKPTLQPEEAVARLNNIADRFADTQRMQSMSDVAQAADLITALQAENAELKKEIADEKGFSMSLSNLVANCNDTLRARDFAADLGPTDIRVIAMAHALDQTRGANADLARKLAAAEERFGAGEIEAALGGEAVRQLLLRRAAIDDKMDAAKAATP